MEVIADTIGSAWHESIRQFTSASDLVRYDSERGPCTEAQDVMFRIADVTAEPVFNDALPVALRELVTVYEAGFLGDERSQGSTVRERLYAWNSGNSAIDQIARAEQVLLDAPDSRLNVVSFWDPSADPALANPVSPLIASFRVRDGKLSSLLVARSVDAWLGAFPMLVGFSSLLRSMSSNTGLEIGATSFLFLSYHVYDIDLPAALSLAQ